TTQSSSRIDVQLDAASALTLESLNTAALELQLLVGTVQDPAGNFNAAVTNLDDLAIDYQPVTTVTVDGFIDPAEWTAATCLVDDSWDSAWTTTAPGDTNDINALYVTWDSTYIYVGIRGIVYGNSWLLYLDTDPGGANGSADLTSLDAWERGATFSGGFRADFQYAAFQHQNAFDGDSFYRILSDTTTADLTGSVITAMDAAHVYYADGGSELAIPWDVLYGLGPGNVPPGAELCLVASVCWDPEPNGELGGDSAPDNVSAVLPMVDNWISVTVDGNADGVPDDPSAVVDAPAVSPGGVPQRLEIAAVSPNPFAAATRIEYRVPGSAAGPVRLSVFDVSGRRVARLVDGPREPGTHRLTWDGRDTSGRALASGVYFVRLEAPGAAAETRRILRLR
ncbi:MAG: T9SS type A sorting domain-containing protein, partial [Gemmatimonadetes bacterium]|nr:T9SS type A sorting domain-containing protein [Gemmatimonadota bacterium]